MTKVQKKATYPQPTAMAPEASGKRRASGDGSTSKKSKASIQMHAAENGPLGPVLGMFP